MRNKNDYKSDKVINLDRYLPDYIKQRYAEGLTNNLFNRFLTKPDFAEFNGYIGQEDTRSELNQIPEDSEFRSKNQLQPIINTSIATENYHLSFNDFLRRLERQGIDIDNFDDWGKSQQFNWVPPIDIDKLINYRNYYWISDAEPEYITIKNNTTTIQAHFEELKLSLFNSSNNKKQIEDISEIPSKTTSDYVLLYEYDRNRATIAKVDGGALVEVEESSDFSGSVLSTEFIDLDFSILTIPDSSSVTISGDFSEDSLGDKIVSLHDGSVEYLANVESVEYNDVTKQSTFHLSVENIPATVTRLSLHPEIFAEMHNYEYITGTVTPTYPPTGTIYDVGKALYYSKVQIASESSGQANAGSLTFTDNSYVFGNLNPDYSYMLEITDGNNKGLFDIDSYSGNSVVLDGNTRLFAGAGISYVVYQIADLEVSGNKTHLDEANDTLLFDNNVISFNISLLKERTLIRDTVNTDWTDKNHWVHKNQVETFANTIQARIPIIEYDNTMELSESSSISYEWRYSAEPSASYITTNKEPNLLELRPIDGDAIEYVNLNTIRVPESYGDLTFHVEQGDILTFTGFNNNAGTYEVDTVDFIVLGSGDRAVSEITFLSSFNNTNDNPTSAKVHPERTAVGDILDISHDHWEFAGITNISASSLDEEKNPLLDEYIEAYANTNSEGYQFESIVGEVWQEFSPTTTDYQAPLIELDPHLHDLCLYEDYQEGDIRVYLDGIRQYGNFQEISQNGSEYVTAIKFDSDVTIPLTSRVRIELGEYYKRDIGKRDVEIKFNSSTGSTEKYNLVDERKVEQVKTEINQYPLFRLYDVFGNSVRESNQIFKFKESSDQQINPQLKRRIVHDSTSADFTFEQLLFKNETDRLLCYKDINESETVKSVWRKGNNNEIQMPEKLDDGEWDIPNSWYYNIAHENRAEVSLKELFRHFRTIVQSQPTNGMSGDPENYFHALKTPNYGLGGTIKEHNDSLDLLASFTLLNNANPINIIQFAGEVYNAQINDCIYYFYSNIDEAVDGTSDILINFVENNKKFDQWFGDSTALDGIKGVKGMIASAAILGLVRTHTPTVITHQEKTYLRHHDGHLTALELPRNAKINRFKNISKTVYKASQKNDLPDASDFDENDFITQVVHSDKDVYLYKVVSGVWEEIDVVKILGDALRALELRLYEVSSDNTTDLKYDFSYVNQQPQFNDMMKESFFSYYAKRNVSEPLTNIDYDPSDPFTWNYAASTINVNPLDGNSYEPGLGSWQALYEDLFGTAYIHEEPWVLQGFTTKPDWWDSEYENTNNLINRKWTLNMWSNILDGMVPLPHNLPDGSPSTGSSDEVQSYQYLPVNIDNTPTTDGIPPDSLVPPYWNSVNSSFPQVKPLFDRDDQDVVINPNATFIFGQNGYNEWRWMNSTSFIHEKLIAAYRLDPMVLVHRTFGLDCVDVNCLQVDANTEKVYSHKDSVFHGEIVNNNQIFKINGIFQWFTHFNRYRGFDGSSSEYRDLWLDWAMELGYVFGNVINTDTFDIRNESLDITSEDYDIHFKKTEGLDNFDFKAIRASINKLPSVLSSNREASADWLFTINFNSPDENSITLYRPENYPIRKVSDTEFKIFSSPVLDAGLSGPTGFTRFTYENSVSLSDSFPSGPKEFNIVVNGETDTVTIDGDDAPTVGDALRLINDQTSDFIVKLDAGDVVVESLTSGSSSFVYVNDTNLFSSIGNLDSVNSGQTPIEFTGYFDVSLDNSNYLNVGDGFEITDSSNFNGSYTIKRVILNQNSNSLRVYVNENVTPLYNTNVNGYIVPNKAVTLPWETGQEVYFTSTGQLPGLLLDYIPYYLIKIDDFSFEIAESPELAEAGTAIENTTSGTGSHTIGRVRSTFKPLNGEVDYAWRRHFPDTREPITLLGPLNLSSIQSLCDVIFGYEEYLTDIGIMSNNERLDNVDEDTGRGREWQLEIEKFIDWIFDFRSLNNQETVESQGEFDPANNSILLDGVNPWGTGSQISIETLNGGTLPSDLTSLASFLPFYVIRNYGRSSIQIAASLDDAINGKALNLSDGSGEVLVRAFKNIKNKPTRTLNPYRRQFSIRHEKGIPANLLKGNDLDVLTTQKVYDDNLFDLSEKELLFFRRDRESVVKLLDDEPKDINGAVIYIDGIEHVILFNHYTGDNNLIYDPFLGINTPRFFVEYVKSLESTQRPSISGLVVRGNGLTSSIEKAINDMRYYYDEYGSFENELSTSQARESLGYEGRKDYLDDLGINGKSQFIFWKGYIQSKGTKKSIDAFSQHRKLQNMSIDEFWAYRLCHFGDAKTKIYPEMNLTTNDVSKKELRLEFSPPTGGTIGQNYVQVKLTDKDRWLNQPDILDAMKPDDAYYFDARITDLITNAENEIFNPQLPGVGQSYVRLGTQVEGVRVMYDDMSGNRQIAIENTQYELVNSTTLKFIGNDFQQWENITIAGITYNYDAENPAKLIDKSDPARVVSDVPIWNPALNQHNPIGYYPVDIRQNNDPARYNNDLISNSNDFWSGDQVGKVWFDDTLTQYRPYYDTNIYPNVDDRSLIWGELAEYGDVNLYQWVETEIAPEQWDTRAIQDEEEQSKPMSERVTGRTRKILYRNINGEWVEERPIIINTTLVDSDLFTSTDDISQYLWDRGENTTEIGIYVNGVKKEDYDFISNLSLFVHIYNNYVQTGEATDKDILTFFKDLPEPTEDQVESGEFMFYTPHTEVTRYNNKKRQEEKLYYYWVEDMKSQKLLNDSSLTLFDARRELKEMKRPYMIIDGLRFSDAGYGVLFGSTFDPEDHNLPTRFSQCIVKGLKNTVKDDNRYVLRFTKNYTLRDHLNSESLDLKNVHWQWKLFRKSQSSKIDRLLWDKVIESATGYALSTDGESLDFGRVVPSLERSTYDNFVEDSASRIGLKSDQILVDRISLLQLLNAIFLDPNREYTTVDIEEFVNRFNWEDPSDIVEMLNSVYEGFTAEEINDIFFEILQESLILNPEHPDFLKTSWVSIDVKARVDSNPLNEIEVAKTYPSDFCFERPTITPETTPVPSPSPSATPTPTPSQYITPTPSSSGGLTPTPTPTPTTGGE